MPSPQMARSAQATATLIRDAELKYGLLLAQPHSPTIEALRALADEHGWSEHDLFLWLVTARGRLDGKVPADLLGSSDDQERVTAAAALDMQAD